MDVEDEKINLEELMMLTSSSAIKESTFADIILPKLGKVTIKKYTLDNGFMSVDVINYGSTITSIKLPDKDHKCNDIVLGFDDITGYMSQKNPYFGATVGRVANRISEASFEYEGIKYFLSKNAGPHTLHGGFCGFDKKVWDAEIVNCSTLVMKYCSPDLEEGFPGTLDTQVTYVLTDDNHLIISFTATTDKTTPVNLTNHSYFNLAGHDTGASGLYEHDLRIYGDIYTELAPGYLTATGKTLPVEGTPLDFRQFKNVGNAVKESNCEGVDINYCLSGEGIRIVARLKHEFSGRSMELYSNQPGVQLYTANYVDGIEGKEGVVYNKHSALCLETQNYPNAVNIKKFPTPWLKPREIYRHTIIYKFNVAFKPKDAETEKKDQKTGSNGKKGRQGRKQETKEEVTTTKEKESSEEVVTRKEVDEENERKD